MCTKLATGMAALIIFSLIFLCRYCSFHVYMLFIDHSLQVPSTLLHFEKYILPNSVCTLPCAAQRKRERAGSSVNEKAGASEK